MVSRRSFLKSSWLAAAGCVLSGVGSSVARGALPPPLTRAGKNAFTVERVDRTTVRLAYRKEPERSMSRELPHWRYVEIFEVRLRSGHTGVGETLLYYTWGVSSDDDVKRVYGRNALDLMWDDSLGAGLRCKKLDSVLGGGVAQYLDHLFRHVVFERPDSGVRRYDVIYRGKRTRRIRNLKALVLQHAERLRARYLMDQVQRHEHLVLPVVEPGDDMVIPDFLEQVSSHCLPISCTKGARF